MVYRAVVVPTFLYDSETWTIYSRHLKAPHQYHQNCLRKILQIRWEERCTNTSDLDRADTPSIEVLTTLIGYDELGTLTAWLTSLPKQALDSQLRKWQ
eukprot:g35881.t1